jgi:polyhydroxybutyrate depolymerase
MFIVVYPDGIDRGWNDGRVGRNADIDDVKFISNLINHLVTKYPVDARKIYVTGFSNGAFMTMRLSCELGNKIAAVAAVSGTLDTSIDAHCQSTYPVSIMLIHGNKDPLVTLEGGSMRNLPGCYVLGHQQLISNWVRRNQCRDTPAINIIPDKSGKDMFVVRSVYSGGRNNTEVISYVVNNGGHTWPGGPQYLPKLLIGGTAQNFNAAEVIWEFFKRHQKE